MNQELIKLILGLGIQLLGKLIPFLGSFLGGPLGFLVGIVINWLSEKLYKWVDQLLRFKGLDDAARQQVEDLKAKQAALRLAQNDPNVTGDARAKALSDFAASARALGKFRVQQG